MKNLQQGLLNTSLNAAILS